MIPEKLDAIRPQEIRCAELGSSAARALRMAT
jgi:hypothetical protein